MDFMNILTTTILQDALHQVAYGEGGQELSLV